MKFKKTHIFFWVSALVICIQSLFAYYSDEVIDINIHDSYFIISSFNLSVLISIFLAFTGLVYYLHNRFKVKLIKVLTQIHTSVTLGSVFTYYIGRFINSKLESENEIDSFPLFDDSNSYIFFILSITLLGLSVQILFIVNSLFSSLKHISKKNS